MVSRLKFSGLLGVDPVRLAEKHLRDGEPAKAEEVYAGAELWEQAARVAGERQKPARAALYLLRARLGDGARDYEGASVGEMAEALSISGHHREAMTIHELTRSYGAAGKAAHAAGQTERAARLYERAREWHEAARCWRELGRDTELLDALLRAASALTTEQYGSEDQGMTRRAREIDFERAALLKQAGRIREAEMCLSRWAAETLDEIQLMEGVVADDKVVEAALALDEVEEAMRLVARIERPSAALLAAVARKSPESSGLVEMFVSAGSPAQAAQLLEEEGVFGRAAELWESAKNWTRAAAAWQRAEHPGDAARCLEAAGCHADAAPLHGAAADHRSAARCYLEAGRPWEAAASLFAAGAGNEALAALMRVQPQDSHYADAVLQLMPVLVDEERQFAEASRRLRLVPTERRGVPDYWYWAGRAFEGAGKHDEAYTAYEKVAQANPLHRDAATRRDALREYAPSPASGGGMGVEPKSPSEQGRTPGPAAPSASLQPSVPSGPSVQEKSAQEKSMPTAGSEPLRVGTELAGRYEILDLLGRGGMGQVYKARDHELDDVVAIKTVLGSSALAEDEGLIREVQICRKITHPNVVRVYDIGRFEGGIFVTMELIEGLPLDVVLSIEQSLVRIRSILGQIASGLREAHRLRVVHRDLKPSNLLMTLDHVKIVDFGIARQQVGDKALQERVAIGSPLYMSPEQLTCRPIDARSDLYALGVIAFLLITGREPFLGASYEEIARAHLRKPPPELEGLRPGIPEGWSLFVGALLEKNPDDRLQSADQVLEALALLQV